MPSWDLPSFPSENTWLEAAPPQCSRAALCRRVELGGVATQLQRDRPPCWLCLLGGCRAGIHPQFTIPACLCHRSHIQQLVARVPTLPWFGCRYKIFVVVFTLTKPMQLISQCCWVTPGTFSVVAPQLFVSPGLRSWDLARSRA